VADGDVLKEFLVALGFKIDEEKSKKFHAALETTGKGVEKLGKGITAVSLALAAGMERIADQFSRLYYTSQLTGATVQNLRDLQFAANQVGVSGDVMIQSLRQVHVMLQSPGGEATIRAFTGYKGQITSADQALKILLGHWHDMFLHGQGYLVRMEAEALHLNETALEPMILNWTTAAKAADDYNRRAQNLGLDDAAQKRMAAQGAEFVRQWHTFTSEIELFYDKAYDDFIGPFTTGLATINKDLDQLGTKFAHLDLGTRRFIEAGVAITGVVGAIKALKSAASFLGIGGAAKAAAGAGGSAGAGAGISETTTTLGILGVPLWAFLATLFYSASAGSQNETAAERKLFEEARRRAGVRGHVVPSARFDYNNPATWPDWLNVLTGGKPRPQRQAYRVPGGGVNSLLHMASYETPAQGGSSYGAAGDLQSWLHGSTSFVPSVRIIDASGIFGGGISGGSGGFAGGGSGGGTSGGGSFGSPLPGQGAGRVPVNKADAIKRLYLHARAPVSAGGLGLDQAHTMALLGNAFAESGFDPMASGDHGTSHGLFQWHNDRWTALQSALGKRASDPLAQLDYAVKEQMQRDPGWFKRQGNLTNDFEHGFERPSRDVDRSTWTDAVSRALGAIGGTALGSVHHHAGDKNVTINQGDMHVTVHGTAGDAVGPMRTAHNRTLGDAVRNLSPVIA
jgi:Phage tail lysozyme